MVEDEADLRLTRPLLAYMVGEILVSPWNVFSAAHRKPVR
jgi:hypothetical protein